MASESSKHLESILQDMKAEPCDLSLQTLKGITGNFADERELGRGGFGVVYKGLLDSGKVVAVKKLVSMPGVKDRQFENEVQHLMMLKHRNIVRFLGYCSETRQVCIKHKGRYCFVEMQERLLCLEYMSKGSLKGHISDEHSGLGWLKRFKIIKGICCGLHYLHEEGQTNTPVVHLDLKPANILLTKEMEPKITDFGLSRLFGEQQSRIYTARVEGTLGYMAREYLDKGIITKKSDIFSLGVIIMEIITGHRDYPEGTGTSIQDFVDDVLKKWKNRLACLRYTPLEKKYQYHQIKVCIEIGLKCVQIDATQRPTTKEVIEILNKCDSMNSKVISEERSRVDQFAKQVYHQAHNSCYAEFFHPRCKVFKKFDSDARSNRPGLVNEDYDEEAVDGSINDAAIAESEASMYGLQVIGYGDLVKLRELGSGILGTVCYGKWRGTNVAIKCIKESYFAGWSSKHEEFNKELWREAHSISKLRHPNIIAFYGVVPNGTGGILATVTEYMLNGSLRSVLLRKHGMLDCQKKLIIAMDAASGMEYLHSRRIVHLFLKCDNLLVNLRDPERPICKVGDFGFSRIKCNTLVSGGVRGHLPWMAPELLNGRSWQVSEKVDVFSFGIVLWEILTGEEPYATMHYGAIVGGIVNNTLRPPVPESCDPEWRKLMEQCWSADPVARPSFVEVNDRLRAMLRVLQSTDNTTEPACFWPETRKKPEDAHKNELKAQPGMSLTSAPSRPGPVLSAQAKLGPCILGPGFSRPGLKPRAGLPSASNYLRAAS